MAQLKDLIVSGPARIIGDLYGSNIYATTFTGALSGTASNAISAGSSTSATNAAHAQTAHYATSATYSASAGSAASATNAAHAQTAHYATSATYSASAGSAASATNAAHAQTAHYASSANTAATAGYATSATNAAHAQTAHFASSANTAATASNATTAGYATTAARAGTAGYAVTANNATFAYDSSRLLKDFIIVGSASYNNSTDILTTSVTGFNSGAFSRSGFNGCCLSFLRTTNTQVTIGLAEAQGANSLADYSYNTYYFSFSTGNSFSVNVGATGTDETLISSASCTSTDIFRIEYSNRYIKFYQNYNCLYVYSIASTTATQLYGFCQLVGSGSQVKNLTFSPIPIYSIGCIESATGVLTLGSF